MSAPPYWALSLIYWLHMLATVIWIGSLACLALLVLPAARKLPQDEHYAGFLSDLQRRLDPLGWVCLLVLVATGMFQMSANPNYSGFLAIDNRWAVAIFVKHVVFFGMTGVSAYLTWGLLPRLQRVAMRQLHSMDAPDASHLRRQETLLIRLNLVLAALVLALTAIARAS
jgi:uncharacterized membrane protein